MITVEPITDEFSIKAVFLNPTIYQMMRDDASPADPMVLNGAPIRDIPGFFLACKIDGVLCGIWWLIWKGDTVEAHTALLESCRGRKAIEATKLAIEWVFRHTNARAITSYAWSDSPAVAWFCRMVGMAPTETRPWANTRKGKLVDITYYAINR